MFFPNINVLKAPAIALLCMLSLFSCRTNKEEHAIDMATGPFVPYTVRMTFWHDDQAYTQGLAFYKDKVYESTGAEESWIAALDLDKGTQEKKVVLERKYFGEGITILNNKVYQLTWKHKKGFIYDVNTFKELGTFTYRFEGWGITSDGTHLLISDGSEHIHYLDTLTFEVVKRLSITENGRKVKYINELEFIDGAIYANQWETNFILKIDPQLEEVVGRLDLSPLANEIKRIYPDAGVLNGIAYNSTTEDILITGKLWPRAYLLRLNQ